MPPPKQLQATAWKGRQDRKKDPLGLSGGWVTGRAGPAAAGGWGGGRLALGVLCAAESPRAGQAQAGCQLATSVVMETKPSNEASGDDLLAWEEGWCARVLRWKQSRAFVSESQAAEGGVPGAWVLFQAWQEAGRAREQLWLVS